MHQHKYLTEEEVLERHIRREADYDNFMMSLSQDQLEDLRIWKKSRQQLQEEVKDLVNSIIH